MKVIIKIDVIFAAQNLVDKIMKKDQISFVKTVSFRELFNEANSFLKAISIQDIEKAQTIRRDSHHNHNIGKLYEFVIAILESKRKTQQDLKEASGKVKKLNKELKKLQENSQSPQKKENQKKQLHLSDQDRIKLKIVEAVQDGLFSSAIATAAKYEFKDLQQTLQRAYEHKWIQAELKRKYHQSGRLPPKVEVVELSKQLELVRNSILTQQLEKVLSKMVNWNERINFQKVPLPSIIKEYLEMLENILRPKKQELMKVAQEEKKVRKYLQTYFPDFQQKQEQYNFYKIICKFIEKEARVDRGSIEGSFTTDQVDPKASFGKQLKVLETLNSVRSQEKETRSKQPWNSIKKIIKYIDHLASIAGFKRCQNETTNFQIEVLTRAKSIISHYKTIKETNQLITSEEKQSLDALIQTNKEVLEFVKISNPIEISSHENSLKSACKAFQNNFKEALRQLKAKLILKASFSDEASSPRTLGKAFIPTYQEEYSDEEERKYMKAISFKPKEQLIDIIRQLREAIDGLETQNMTKRSNEKLMQNKIKNLDQVVKNSQILLSISISPLEGEQFLMEELTLAKKQLIDELDRKTIEFEQLKNSIPRIIEDAQLKIQLQKDQLFKKEKSKYQEDLQQKETKIKQLKGQVLTLEVKVEELTENNHQQLIEVESRIKTLSEEKGKLEVQFENLREKNKIRVDNNYKSQPQSCREQVEIPEVSYSQKFFKPTLSLTRTEQVSIFSTESTVPKDSKLQSELILLKQKIEEQNSLINQLKECLVQKSREFEKQNILFEQLKKIVQEKNASFEELQRELKKMKEQVKIKEERVVQQTGHLFSIGSIFDVDSQDRSYLIETLTNFIGPIRKTNLLYRYDSFNKTNPHKYIDKKSHLVFIFKTIYGKYVAAYSREMIDPKGSKVGYGLLISIWNKTTYEVINRKKAVTYDDYFIIFGNSELRLKALQTKIFSNFGINNGYFNCRGDKVDSLLGEGMDRQVPLQSYEFYSLQLIY